MNPSIAYVSLGRLFVKPSDGETREIESPFARQAMEREARDNELHGWKSRSGIWGQMGMSPPAMSQWETTAETRRIAVSDLARGDRGEVLYALDMGDVGGLFLYKLNEDRELRLMHKEGFQTSGLSRHRDGDLIFCTRRPNGTFGMTIGENDGRRLRQLAGGDSIDSAPSWVPGDGRRVVFQSAPIDRATSGEPVDLAPFGIEVLDVESKEVTPLFRIDDSDCLNPRMTSDETLFYIRRPHRSRDAEAPGALHVLKDLVLFPFRLLRALFHFLNFVSVMFSGKPLTTMESPRDRADDHRAMSVWGHMIDTRRAMRQSQKSKQPVKLVPGNWVLMRRRKDGQERKLADHVLSFDVGSDGTVVYTDGGTVFVLGDDQPPRQVCRDQLIEKVVLLEI